MPRPKFVRLEQFLLSLGFVHVPVTGPYIVLEHPESEAELAFRPYQPDDLVEPMHLLLVRHTLDMWGLMSREEFEEELRGLAVAG